MDYSMIKKIVDFSDVYEILAQGVNTIDELKAALKNNGATGGTLQRRVEYLLGDPAYLSVDQDKIFYDYSALYEELDELNKNLIPEKYRKSFNEKYDIQIEGYKKQVEDLTSEVYDYKKKLMETEKIVSQLQEELSNNDTNTLRAELKRKVLVASSISVGPKEHITDECFLVDPESLLDVDKCVARYGGELDSFYEEIPEDEADTGFEPGHELNEKNHALRIMKTIGTDRFFKKRIKDNAEVKEIEERTGKLFPGHRSECEAERDRILHNRFVSLNNIIKCDRLTNQEKLMMYAMNSMYHGTNVERLLNYAGAHCINANFLIDILEDPDVCMTYENTVAFLSQFADASEFRMKLNLARELIEGKWYITADYNGHKTKFQLVPIEEFNELRKAAGLPVSKFTNSDKKTETKEETIDEKVPQKPDFVESLTSEEKIDLPDDGFFMPHVGEEDYPF